MKPSPDTRPVVTLLLHHFRKEARYLLPRWWLWAGVLIVELMINLEWIMPMTVRGDYRPAYVVFVSWLGAAVMVLTQVPEDAAASPARFIATRPLPPSSYWLARVLVFVLMVVVPLAVQQGMYLALSQRPLGEVLTGMTLQAIRAISVLGWIVALSALWRGWRWIVATVLSVAGFVIVFQSSGDSRYASADMAILAWHGGLGLVALALATMTAWAAHRWEWRAWKKTAAQAAVVVMLAWLCRHWQIADWNDTATDLPKAEALTKQLQVSFPMENVEVFKPNRPDAGAQMVSIPASIHGLPSQISLNLYPREVSVSDGDRALAMHPEPRVPGFLPKWLFFELNGQLARHAQQIHSNLPSGSILSLPGNSFIIGNANAMQVSFDEPLPDQHKPLTITNEFDLVWRDWKTIIELPVQAGATAESSDSRWKILNVRYDQGLVGNARPGAVTIDYRAECRGGIESQFEVGLRLLLYSPDRRIAWTTTAQSQNPDFRAITTGWSRRLQSAAWVDVLQYADGERIDVNRDHLKLIVLEPRHLGTTRMTWKSPLIKLADHMSRDDHWVYTTDEGLYAGRELQAFEQRVASLKQPGPGAVKQDVLRYLYDVLSAAATMKFDKQTTPQPLRDILSAVAKDHLAVMLEMSDSMASKWADLLAEILTPLLTDAHKTDLVSHLPERAWLAPLVFQRGWAKDAVPVLVPSLKTKEPIDIHLIKLVLKSCDDDAVLRLLLENFRRHPDREYEIIDYLVRRPLMRAEVKAVANELWAGFDPTLQKKQDNRLRIAIKFGNAEALDYALRLAALGGEAGGDVWRLVFDLPDLLGLPRKPKDAKVADLAPSYRPLKASDFEYQPDKMLWKKKP